MRLHVSKKNSKLGKTPSVSIPPMETCVPGFPCGRECYAMKSYRLYPKTKIAWNENLLYFQTDPGGYFGEIAKYCVDTDAPFFRWQVGGDIVNQRYLQGMIDVAKFCPDTKYLAFTKNQALDFSGCPSNLVIIFSMWPNWGTVKADGFRRAWMQDGKETRVPADAMECSGFCEACGLCWHLPQIGRDVVFHKH